MKLIQLNIWQGILMYQAMQFLKKERPDILNLQEVTTGIGDVRSAYFSVLENLSESLPELKYCHFQRNASSPYSGRRVYDGQAVLSRYRITRKNVVFTNGKPIDNGVIGRDNINICFLQHVRIETGNEIINDLNYHGYWLPYHKGGNEVTRSHCRTIADYVDGIDSNEKVILTGDFNLSPHSKSLAVLNRKLTNLVIQHGIRTTRPPIRDTMTPVDFIFVNDKVRVRSFTVPNAKASDHLPLILEFD